MLRLGRAVKRAGQAAALAAMVIAIGGHADAATIDWVTVGADQNPQGANAYLAIPYDFRIMKFEWTNTQYVQFLNAVDPNGTNPNSIYRSNMGTSFRGGISFDATRITGGKYQIRPNFDDKPVSFVSFFEAARVANWLQNGAMAYATTASGSAAINNGAYTLNGAVTGAVPAKNADARYWVPYDIEWIKAALFKREAASSTATAFSDSYWKYPTQSDTAPTSATASATGVGSAGATGASANWNAGAFWNGQTGIMTSVGTNGRPSPYGAFDMGGNIAEWVDNSGVYWYGGTRSYFKVLGGDYYGAGTTGSNIDVMNNNVAWSADGKQSSWGFRLAASAATPSVVPELAPDRIGAVLALLAGGLALRERRRFGRCAC